MIDDLLRARGSTLACIAQAWLSAGARTVGLWEGERLAAAWPAGSSGRGDLVAPIRGRRRSIGVLRVDTVPSPAAEARAAADARLLGELARLDEEIDGVAAELIEVQDQLLGLARLNRSTMRSLRTEESLRSVAREAAAMLKARAALVSIAGSCASFRPDGSPGPVLPPDLLIRLLQEGGERTVWADEEPALAEAGVRTLTMVPVPLQEALTMGALGIIDGPDASHAPAMKLARTFAAVAGGLIERGLLYQDQIARMRMLTEMDLARTVQRNLLPQRPPVVRGLDIFARATPAQHVGGDLYDFVVARDSSLIFSLGDVTGKGIAAALIMAMTRTALRSKAANLPQPEPIAILTRANEDLYNDFTQVEMFATAVVGQVKNRQIRLANAGHAPVILHHAGSPPRLMEATGIPLGVLPEPLCELQCEPFGPGDLLVVASDGLTEAERPNGEMYGIERLIALIARSAGASAETLGQRIFAEVAEFSGGKPQSDDQTLLVIRGADDL
jgi:sigma-B regulation protein RsbU (phosphoserine phosphatase)